MVRWFVDRLHERGIPSVSLRRLLPGAHFVGGTDWEVSGCCDDHRRLDPGQLFVAVPEAKPGYDGHRYISEALDRGAAGVVAERLCPEAGRLQVVVADARAAHARICQALSGDPSKQLATLGITGSQGKTITALMIRSILEAAGDQFGLIGPSEFSDGARSRMLKAGFEHAKARALGAGAAHSRGLLPEVLSCPMTVHSEPRGWLTCSRRWSTAGARERSSKSRALRSRIAALKEWRSTRPLSRPSPEWVQLTPETLISLRRAKAKLFRQVVPGGLAVVNADDRNAEMLGGVNLEARRVAFALQPAASSGMMVDISARLESVDGSGTRMRLHGFDREIGVHVPLVGVGAAKCALAAAALAWGLGIDGLRLLRVLSRSRRSPDISRLFSRDRTSR